MMELDITGKLPRECSSCFRSVKPVANEETLLRKQCCGRKCFGEQTGKHLLRTQNVFEGIQKHFLRLGCKICVRNKCCGVRANGETFASVTMFPQQCFLVCHGLNYLAICSSAMLHLHLIYPYIVNTLSSRQVVRINTPYSMV